mmetsp:Transcript_18022/g.38506  ORF Transcript_18022/g.38506 Transcript_18022/m.38506 type:complete len:854 (-) Transcript_18022:62-2623(-)
MGLSALFTELVVASVFFHFSGSVAVSFGSGREDGHLLDATLDATGQRRATMRRELGSAFEASLSDSLSDPATASPTIGGTVQATSAPTTIATTAAATTTAASSTPSTTASTTTQSGTTTLTDVKAYVVDGCPKHKETIIEKQDSIVDVAGKFGTRCCGNSTTPSCGSSVTGCFTGDYASSQKACAEKGLRVCTKAELKSNLCCDTGCGFDYELVWASDVVTEVTTTKGGVHEEDGDSYEDDASSNSSESDSSSVHVSSANVVVASASSSASTTSSSSSSTASSSSSSSSSSAAATSGDSHGSHSDAGATAAWILFAVVTCSMLLMHLLNSPDPVIKGGAYVTLSHNMSILGAVLLFHSMKDVSLLMISTDASAAPAASVWAASSSSSAGSSASTAASASLLQEGSFMEGMRSMMDFEVMSGSVLSMAAAGSGTSPGAEEQAMAIGRFALAFLILELLLRMFKSSHLRLAGLGLLGAHFVGFVASDAFATIQEATPWNEDLPLNVLWVVITIVVMALMVALCEFLRKKLNDMDGEMDASEESWEHQCEHAETEFIAFAGGLVITQVVRMAIMGKVPHFHGVQKNADTGQCATLGGFALFCGLVVIIAAWKVPKHLMEYRAVAASRAVLSMTAGWSILFWGKWTFWNMTKGEGYIGGTDVMTAQVAMATVATMCGFTVILVIRKLEPKLGLHAATSDSMCECMVLVMGLAWESVFMCAIYFLNKHKATELARVTASLQDCLFIVCLVVPVWYLYIMPKSLELSHGHGHEHGKGDHHGGHAEIAPQGPAAPTEEADTGGRGSRRARGRGEEAAPAPAAETPAAEEAEAGGRARSRRGRQADTAAAAAPAAADDENY